MLLSAHASINALHSHLSLVDCVEVPPTVSLIVLHGNAVVYCLLLRKPVLKLVV